MDFTQALSYPFKSIAKVASIVIVMTIAFAVFLGMILNSFNWMDYIQELYYAIEYNMEYAPRFEPNGSLFIPGIIGLIIVMIVQGFWLSGYSIRVIRAAMDGFEKLPNIEFGVDMKKGFYLFLASILYGLLFVPFFFIVMMLIAMSAGPTGESGLAGLVFCSAFIVGIPFMFLMGWAYYIGMARCAAYDDNSALFQIWTNLRIARENVKASLSLTGYQILLGITYWFLGQFVNNAVQIGTSAFSGNSLDQTFMLLAFLVPFMLSLAMNIIQQFSNMHLVAQYAYNIGIVEAVEGKFK